MSLKSEVKKKPTNLVVTAFQVPIRSHTIAHILETEQCDIITRFTHTDQGRKLTLSYIQYIE